MELNEYQQKAKSTADYPGFQTLLGLNYVGLGIAGEAGEVADKVKKIMREERTMLFTHLTSLLANDVASLKPYPEDIRVPILKELGDVLWYVAMVADELGYSLEDVARANNAKLRDRKERGALYGNGDNR